MELAPVLEVGGHGGVLRTVSAAHTKGNLGGGMKRETRNFIICFNVGLMGIHRALGPRFWKEEVILLLLSLNKDQMEKGFQTIEVAIA